MCGIIGIVAKGPVNQALYEGLLVLQHRGQDAAGILTSDDKRIHLRKDNGLVRDVFQQRHLVAVHERAVPPEERVQLRQDPPVDLRPGRAGQPSACGALRRRATTW